MEEGSVDEYQPKQKNNVINKNVSNFHITPESYSSGYWSLNENGKCQ